MRWSLLIVLLFYVAIMLIPINSDAGYDRFKLIGKDKIGNNDYEIRVIQDTETGCLYGRTGSTYNMHTFVILNEDGKPDCN